MPIINMCTNSSSATSQLVPASVYNNLKSDSPCTAVQLQHPAAGFPGTPAAAAAMTPSVAAIAEYQQRLQLYDYAQAAAARLRFAHPALFAATTGHYNLVPFALGGGGEGGVFPYGLPPGLVRFDPRARFIQEEPKPQHSYIGLIAIAILSVPDKKMVLSDIYQHILDHYPYFRNRGPGWRNSIRHNLSLNDCFIKSGRSANGKGHYWAIHPANLDDFQKGDFRRRKAQRKVRKHMGLAVPEDDDSPATTPPPPNLTHHHVQDNSSSSRKDQQGFNNNSKPKTSLLSDVSTLLNGSPIAQPHQQIGRRRQFDVESLLAPDPVHVTNHCRSDSHHQHMQQQMTNHPYHHHHHPALHTNSPAYQHAILHQQQNSGDVVDMSLDQRFDGILTPVPLKAGHPVTSYLMRSISDTLTTTNTSNSQLLLIDNVINTPHSQTTPSSANPLDSGDDISDIEVTEDEDCPSRAPAESPDLHPRTSDPTSSPMTTTNSSHLSPQQHLRESNIGRGNNAGRLSTSGECYGAVADHNNTGGRPAVATSLVGSGSTMAMGSTNSWPHAAALQGYSLLTSRQLPIANLNPQIPVSAPQTLILSHQQPR